jgi:hypothetical protein
LAHDIVLCGAFGFALTAAWLVDPPYEGPWAAVVDRLSIVYVSFGWLFSAALIGLDAYLVKRAAFVPYRNIGVAVALGALAFLCWAAIQPAILKGPFGQVDPAVYRILFLPNPEMLPMWRLTDWTIPHAACLVLTWISLAVVIAKTSGRQRSLWIGSAILMVPISLMGIRYIRASLYVEIFGSIPLGLILAEYTRRYPKYIGYGAVAASTGVMLAAYSATLLVWNKLQASHENGVAAFVAVCNLNSLSETIAPIRNLDAIVMTEMNLAPMVLYLSPYLRTVAGPYHRNTDGILDQLAFFGAHSDNDARAILDKRRIKFVLICDTGEQRRADAFGDRIIHDQPDWLEQIGSSSPQSGFRLYRVLSGDR